MVKMAEDLGTFLIWIMGVVIGVTVGGIITFLVQKSIQGRAWKKERTDKIYAPLLDKLYNVEANLYEFKEYPPSYRILHEIREKHLLHWIKPKLRNKLWHFDIELQHFVGSIITAINIIKGPVKKEILQKIKEEHKDEVKMTTPFCNEFFWDELAKLVLKKEDNGGFFGRIDIATDRILKSSYGDLEKYFETRISFDNFIKDFASKIKEYPFFKHEDFKGKLRRLVEKTQELRGEVEKEMKI